MLVVLLGAVIAGFAFLVVGAIDRSRKRKKSMERFFEEE